MLHAKLAVLLSLALTSAGMGAEPASFEARGPGGGGALFSPSFSPDGSELTVGCDMSGFYHSGDRGHTWSLVPFGRFQGGRSAKVFWSGASRYSIDNTGDVAHIVRSTDDGITWSAITNDPTAGDGVYGMSVHPNDPKRLLATGWNAVYATRDGGATWKTVQDKPDANAGTLLGGVFWDGADVYLGTNAGLFVSHDSGWSFAASTISGIPSGKRLVSLTGGRRGSVVGLFMATADSGDVYNGIMVEDFHNSNTSLWTWKTGATAWTSSSTGIDPTHRLYLLGQATTTTDTLYAAGGIYQTDWPEIYRSVDGGGHWAEVLGATGNVNVSTGWAGTGGDRDWSYGGSACGFGVASGNGAELAYTDYGFIHISDDGGATWRQGYVDARDQNPAGAGIPKGKAYRSAGLENTSSWMLAWSDSLNVFSGYTDIKGIRSTDAGVSWGFGFTGDNDNSMYRIAKAPDGKLYAATSTVHDLYQSTRLTDAVLDAGSGHVLASSDKGATWTTLWNPAHIVSWVALDPSDPYSLYASVVHSTQGGIYVTHNLNLGSGATWTRLASPARTAGHPYALQVLSDGSVVATYSGQRNAAGAFTATSGVFRLAKGATTWQDLSDPGMQYWTKDLVVDPSDASQKTWWVGVFSGWGGAPNGLGGLYRTVDAGAHWSKVWNEDRVESVGIPPDGDAEIYATTETDGLWHAPDRSASTPAFGRVDAYPFRQPVRVFFNPYAPSEMWVTSFGNGLRVGRRDGKPVDGLALASRSPKGFSVRAQGGTLILEGLRPGPTALRILRLDGTEDRKRKMDVDASGTSRVHPPGPGLWLVLIPGQGTVRLLVP